MVWLGAIGGLAFVLAAVIVGVRLMWLARRTRGLPELAIGAGLFMMGGLGYPLTVLAQQVTQWPDAVRTALVLGHEVFGVVGMTLLAVFNWRVFRPDALWAKAFVGAVAVSITGLMLAQGATAGWLGFAEGRSFPFALAAIPNAATLVWAGLESIRYHRAMKKRARLGLASPALVDRFRLWAVGTLCAALVTVVSLGAQLQGADVTRLAALLLGTFGLVSAGSMWLAFLPPAAYVRWVARSGAAA